ncbi:CsgG/HfaB family protein [Desulfoplanes sp.]
MRFSFIVILFLGIVPLCGCKSAPHTTSLQKPLRTAAAPPKTLAILPFENNSITSPQTYTPLSNGLAAMLAGDLQQNNNAVKIVERAKIAALLKEIALGQTGSIDTATAVKAGRMLGAQSIGIGAFTVLGNQVRMDCRIIKVETSEIVMAESITGSSNDFLGLEKKLAQNIAQSLDMGLAIAKEQGNMEAALLFSRGAKALDAGDREKADILFERCLAIAPGYKQQIDGLRAE